MSHGVGILLLAAVGGYWVFERAETHKGELKKLGQFLGGLIIIVSLIGVACHVWYLVTCSTGYCPIGKTGKGLYCPYPSKTSPPKAESQ